RAPLPGPAADSRRPPGAEASPPRSRGVGGHRQHQRDAAGGRTRLGATGAQPRRHTGTPADSRTTLRPASKERYCLTLEEEELAELRLFCAWRRREALGQGVARLVPPKLEECTCEKCREPLRPGEYGVFAARAGEQCCWHPACFACQACGQALINLIYFYHDGHLYCGRHHAELLRPRCPACDQLIFSRRCTEAEGRRWHENHFCCQDCAGPLGGGLYALPGGDPCCPSCFESRYSDAGSRPAGTQEGRASLGEAELGRGEDPDSYLRKSASISRAALLATGDNSSVETQTEMLGSSPEQECQAGNKAEAPKGQEQSLLETPLDPKEDAPCPTCSSSSESEPEGFFLGQRLPGPGRPPEVSKLGTATPPGSIAPFASSATRRMRGWWEGEL
uniref:LIM zinc-binding domain-containing protein n=1 Tax=Sus scrofa TaxID=9823 RepID=A0A4X1SJS2_PIG